jgi:Flp pilus assembly protein TadD
LAHLLRLVPLKEKIKVTVKTKNTKLTQKKNAEPVASKKYQKALDLAEAGKHHEALECIQKYLAESPDNAEILNDTGAILYCLNRSNEAIEHFIKANELQPDSAEIIWNLVEAYLSEKKAKQAAAFFDTMEKLGILNAEILNRTAEVLINNGEISEAHKAITKSLEISPAQPVLHPMLEIISRKMAEN